MSFDPDILNMYKMLQVEREKPHILYDSKYRRYNINTAAKMLKQCTIRRFDKNTIE